MFFEAFHLIFTWPQVLFIIHSFTHTQIGWMNVGSYVDSFGLDLLVDKSRYMDCNRHIQLNFSSYSISSVIIYSYSSQNNETSFDCLYNSRLILASWQLLHPASSNLPFEFHVNLKERFVCKFLIILFSCVSAKIVRKFKFLLQ